MTHVCLPQLPLTWCLTPRLYNRRPTWRTGPWPCCSVPWKRTASRPPQSTPTPLQATVAFYGSPPRSTTTANLTSAPRMAAMHGFGMTATGRPCIPPLVSQLSSLRFLSTQTRSLESVQVGCEPWSRQKSNLHLWKPLSTPRSLRVPFLC